MQLVHEGARRIIEPNASPTPANATIAPELVVAAATVSIPEPLRESVPVETTVVVNPAGEKPVDLSPNPES